MNAAPLPRRIWMGLLLMIGSVLSYCIAMVVMGNQVSGIPFERAPDPSALFYKLAAFWLASGILGLLGLVLLIAGFIDYARRLPE